MSAYRVEALSARHGLEEFDCGVEILNRYLSRHALQNQFAGVAQTYLALFDNRVVGFYSLAVGQIEFDDAIERLKKGVAAHPIPIMLIARLAIDLDHQGKGLGRALLKNAILKTLQVAEIAGLRALVVHAKDENGRRFYEQIEFIRSAGDPFRLVLPLKDARRLIS